MSNNKATKFIATIGPASNHENILLSMVKKGVNAFRLNFSHGDLSAHLHSIEIMILAAILYLIFSIPFIFFYLERGHRNQLRSGEKLIHWMTCWNSHKDFFSFSKEKLCLFFRFLAKHIVTKS